MVFRVTNVETGGVIDVDCDIPRHAIYYIYEQWLDNPDNSRRYYEDLSVPAFPVYDYLHKTWIWENWRVYDAKYAEEFEEFVTLTSVTVSAEWIDFTFDRCDVDDYTTVVRINVSDLFRVLMKHVPDCILVQKLGGCYR